MPDPMLSVNRDAMVDARLRQMISESDNWRQRAVSDFVVRHFAVACDMRKLLDLRQYGENSKDLDAAIDHCELTLRQGFRQTFGHDMIAEAICDDCGGCGRIEFDHDQMRPARIVDCDSCKGTGKQI